MTCCGHELMCNHSFSQSFKLAVMNFVFINFASIEFRAILLINIFKVTRIHRALNYQQTKLIYMKSLFNVTS